jgi:tetratricopeptide (TPR) repeat protein
MRTYGKLALAALLASGLAAPLPAAAQSAGVADAPAADARGDSPGERLDALFEELAGAGEEEWRPIQNRIQTIWARSPSSSMTFLLSRAVDALQEKELGEAEAFLDDLVRLAPDFAEGWNKRATVHFLREDYGRAVADIQRVLALEPRHFGALQGLGMILERLDRDADAYRVYRRALELHPNLEQAREGLERLAPEVEGRPL